MVINTSTKELVVRCDTKELGGVRDAVRSLCTGCGIAEKESNLITLVVDEAVASIILQSAETGCSGEIGLTIDINNVRVKIAIDDRSGMFDISEVPQTEFITYINKIRKYQMGFFVIREVMDEVVYSYKKGFENELVLVKFLT